MEQNPFEKSTSRTGRFEDVIINDGGKLLRNGLKKNDEQEKTEDWM